MNHSCAPTCLGPSADFEVAVRDISPGEELTDDYAALSLQVNESFDCHCRAWNCRRHISPADVVTQAAAWNAMLQPALEGLGAVAQPLGPFLKIVSLK